MDTFKATQDQLLQWGMKARRDFAGKSEEALASVAEQCEMYEGRLREQAGEIGENDAEKDELLRGSLRCTVRKTIAQAMLEGRLKADVTVHEAENAHEVLAEILEPVITLNEATPRKKI